MPETPLSASAVRGAVDLSGLVRSAQNPSGGRAQPTGPAASSGGNAVGSAIVRDVDESTFNDVVELSRTVPVVVEFYADGIAPVLGAVVASYGGRLTLATVDGNRNPQIAQAFQIQQVPAVVALVGGRPVPLFVGIPGESEVRQVLDQLLEVAAQNGVTGTITPGGNTAHGAGGDGTEANADSDTASANSIGAVEPPLPPLHQEAYDAITAEDYGAAAAAYRTAITQNPRDQLAVAGLAQVSLLMRLENLDAIGVRSAAAADPDNSDVQLAVADLDLSGGHVDDAFARLLRVFAGQSAEGKTLIRTRLLDFFEIVGGDDPRTVAARRALTALLY
jgi:putative thioredoxin